jgi:hypothetical protein
MLFAEVRIENLADGVDAEAEVGGDPAQGDPRPVKVEGQGFELSRH